MPKALTVDRAFRLDFTPLHAQRVLAQLSRAEVATAVGVAQQTIWRWETNKYPPNVEQLVALSRAFGVPMTALFRVHEQAGS